MTSIERLDIIGAPRLVVGTAAAASAAAHVPGAVMHAATAVVLASATL